MGLLRKEKLKEETLILAERTQEKTAEEKVAKVPDGE